MTVAAAAIVILLATPAGAARLTPPARQAFEQYVAAVESRLAWQHGSPETYLAALNADPGRRAPAIDQFRSGYVEIEPVGGGVRQVPGGLLHHWRATSFVPGAKSPDMQALLRDFNHLSYYYSPEVESSRALEDHGGVTTVSMRLKKQQIVAIVLDTEYNVQTHATDPERGYSISRSTHIWEVDAPGTSHERRLPEGVDDGFLWRLNSYWSFVELPDGLLIECEAVSLTRDAPSALRWLAAPLVQQLPRESLEFTLKATRNALADKSKKEIHR